MTDRDAVRDFLGFRHISGLRPWKPEAKARYLTREVELEVEVGSTRPFADVAKRVGSNTQGVRASYVALALLRRARTECGADVSHVLAERFGVWVRCMNSGEVRQHFGFGTPRTYDEVQAELNGVDCERLEQVIRDLTPQGAREKALLYDSRDVTRYGLVLADGRATAVLRKYGDLKLAIQLVAGEDISGQIDRLSRRVDALRDEVSSTVELANENLLTASATLLRSATLLDGVVKALSPAND